MKIQKIWKIERLEKNCRNDNGWKVRKMSRDIKSRKKIESP